MSKANTCFIDPESKQPFPDQWKYLQEIKRASIPTLERVLNNTDTISDLSSKINTDTPAGVIEITLSNQIILQKHQTPPTLMAFLKENLTLINKEYMLKKKMGKNTFGISPFFKLIRESEDRLILPKGFIGKLIRFCKEQNINFKLIDQRKKLTHTEFTFSATLHEYQQVALAAAEKKEMGVIVAPPGSGKTIIGLALAAIKKQPTLILVHRKQLLDQWIKRIQSFLGIAEPHIGKISEGKMTLGFQITVGMIQSLATLKDHSLFSSFGTIIIDECHHVPAKTFSDVISRFASYYTYGLTATPIRKNSDEKIIFLHIGEVLHEVNTINSNLNKSISVIIRETELLVPFDYKADDAEMLSNILIHDSARNLQIIDDIQTELRVSKKLLVLTERNAHVNILNQYLKGKCKVLTISGEDSPSSRKQKFSQISAGNFQVLISTGQFLGEGTDIECINSLFLVYPFSFEGKLTQYIGRVQRSDSIPTIYDYRDLHVEYLERQFRNRNKYYKKLLHAEQLNKFEHLQLIFDGDSFVIAGSSNRLHISCLDIDTPIERFKEEVVWRVRVLNYNEDTAELTTEIIDYNAFIDANIPLQSSLQFMIVEKIRFRSISTPELLRSVILEQPSIQRQEAVLAEDAPLHTQTSRAIVPKPEPIELKFSKIMKVPFSKITFDNGEVSFKLFINEFSSEIDFEIKNNDIRIEFESIKDYFPKVLKKKTIDVEIEIIYSENGIISKNVTSEDIDKIDSSVIENARFEFVKRRILKNNETANTGLLNTLENILDKSNARRLYLSGHDLISDILKIKSSKHFLQLQYLSSKHLSTVLKLRFVLDPFSFLFLLPGDKQYHLVWETLNSEEATYIWHFDKNPEALRAGLNEVNNILNEMSQLGKLDYLRKEHDNFSRIVHDYSDAKRGFILWKGMLQQKLT